MLTIRDIMTHAVVTVHMDDTLHRIHGIFEESRFHHLVVLDDHEIVGVISDRDVLKNMSPFMGNAWMERTQDRNTLKRKAHQIMHRKPITVTPDTSLTEAASKLLHEGVSCLPVVGHDHRLQGIVTWRDLLPHCFMCDPARDEAA